MANDMHHHSSATEAAWLSAAYEVLTENGVEAVKVMPLAKRLGLTRTGFYWHFRDRDALLEAMVRRWEEKNTGNLVAQCDAFAENICEGLLNLFDCWLNNQLFDSRLDLAIRNWARNDPALQVRLDEADATRMKAIATLFLRFGYSAAEAEVRAMTVIYTQIGYISMQIAESDDERLARIPHYVELFTGLAPTAADIDRFNARHARLNMI